MHMKKITYILTALLIAAIVGLLIWGHGVRSAGRSLIPAGIRRHIRRRSVRRERRGFRKPAAAPDVSESPSETPPETSEDAEEAYAQRVGKSTASI